MQLEQEASGVMIDEEVLVVRCEGASDEEILEVNQVGLCLLQLI